MVSAVALAAHVRVARADIRAAIGSALIASGAVMILWFVAGYELRLPSPAEASVFGKASLNLMSPVVPFYSSVVPHLPHPAIQNATGWQWDGANFLGLGTLALVALVLATARRSAFALVRAHWVLVVVILLLAAYAPGDRWFIGNRLLFELPIGADVRQVLAVFRATGRFFWPFVYAATLGAPVVLVRRFGARGTLAVAAFALLQLIDTSATRGIVSNALAHPWARQADWAYWQRVLPGYRRLAMYPAASCWENGRATEHDIRVERELELLAASNGLSTNEAYTGRQVVGCEGGRLDAAALRANGLAADTLYVLFKHGAAQASVDAIGREHCADLADAWLCSASRPVVAPGTPSASSP
ncbi:MAG TPA: hypothetical protein VIF62_37545 [Labilithrix sp.]